MNALSIIERAADRPFSLRRRTNAMSVVTALDGWGRRAGLDQPHRLAHYLCQLGHESMDYQYDREVWGPTPAQKRYEGRRDLGNVKKGDGKRFSGRGPIQLTGRANYRAFTKWARRSIDGDAPDFEEEPEKLNADPWEGLAAVWYWTEGNPTGQSLNRLADRNDIEMVTRRINGGLNGFADRQRRYARIALVIAGYGPADVRPFQRDAGLTVDGIAGPITRGALHRRLVGLSSIVSDDVRDAPVVHETERPTVPRAVEQQVARKTRPWEWLTGLFGPAAGGGALIFGMQWQTAAVVFGAGIAALLIVIVLRRQIVSAVRDIRAAVDDGDRLEGGRS